MQTQNSGEAADMHMISGVSVLLIHHLDGEPLGVGAAVGVGPRPRWLRSRRAVGVLAVGCGGRVVEGVAFVSYVLSQSQDL